MIVERPVASLVAIETYDPATSSWTAWTGPTKSVTIVRGGRRTPTGATVAVGLLTLTLHDAGDPMAGSPLRPGLVIRVKSLLSDARLYTGRIADLDVGYVLNKTTGARRAIVTITATDAVAVHAKTTRYGAISDAGAGFETWAQRIIRLGASSTAAIEVPADDAPIVRYGI